MHLYTPAAAVQTAAYLVVAFNSPRRSRFVMVQSPKLNDQPSSALPLESLSMLRSREADSIKADIIPPAVPSKRPSRTPFSNFGARLPGRHRIQLHLRHDNLPAARVDRAKVWRPSSPRARTNQLGPMPRAPAPFLQCRNPTHRSRSSTAMRLSSVRSGAGGMAVSPPYNVSGRRTPQSKAGKRSSLSTV